MTIAVVVSALVVGFLLGYLGQKLLIKERDEIIQEYDKMLNAARARELELRQVVAELKKTL